MSELALSDFPVSPARVAQPRAMLTASYSLSLPAKRVLLMFMSELNRATGKADNNVFTVKPAQYRKLFGGSVPKSSADLTAAMVELYEADIRFVTNEDGDEKAHYMRWLPGMVISKRGSHTLTFNPEIMPFLIDLSKGFTAFNVQDVCGLKATNQIRLYEELATAASVGKGNGWRVLSLPFFAEHYDFKKTTVAYASDFKRHFLDGAVKQINEATPLRVAYTNEGEVFKFTVIDTRKVEKANTDGQPSEPDGEDTE